MQHMKNKQITRKPLGMNPGLRRGDKAVLITGGAKRVGATIALHFAQNGYDVALHYNHSKADAVKLQKQITKLGRRCEIFSLDLKKTKEIPALLAKVKKSMPHCVALINNASIFERAEFAKTNEALFDRQFAVNFKAPFFVTQAFAKTFGKGAVINMCDTDIVTTQGSHFAYLLAKKSLAAFTEMVAAALSPNIRVNAVCPVIVLPSNELDRAYMKRLEKMLPDKRIPSVQEVAQAVYNLCESDVSNEFVFVDGGKHLL
jgi:pteridine reductase